MRSDKNQRHMIDSRGLIFNVSCFIEHSRCAVRSHQHYLCPLPTYQKSGCAPFEIDFLTLRDMHFRPSKVSISPGVRLIMELLKELRVDPDDVMTTCPSFFGLDAGHLVGVVQLLCGRPLYLDTRDMHHIHPVPPRAIERTLGHWIVIWYPAVAYPGFQREGCLRVSRQAVLDECSSSSLNCYHGYHGAMVLTPFCGIPWAQSAHSQVFSRGIPLAQCFALVLHKLVSSIEADDDCINLSFNAWYLDDGILVGERSAAVRALHLIKELGPHLGLFINYPKCEVFSRNGISLFPASVKSSILPNLEILGAPIGDIVHCSRFFAEKHNNFKVLLRAISDVAAVDLHVAISLLHMCGGYCKLVHLARTTPANLCEDSLKFFDEEVRLCFSSCVAIDVPDTQWQQAQLSPKLGGLGLRSLSLHSCAAFISSVASLEMGNPDNTHLQQAILRFNARVSPQDSITMESVLNSPPQQKSLSQKLDSFAFHSLLSSASLVNKARMLSVSSPHASSWITAIPSTSFENCTLTQQSTKWPLGGGLVSTHQRPLPVPFAQSWFSILWVIMLPLVDMFCCQAHLSVRVEAGFGLSRVQRNTRPADVPVQDWVRGSPAAIDITVTSPLTPAMLRMLAHQQGQQAYAAECRKHEANDTKCQELGWTCIPLAVETFGHWGKEAQAVFPVLPRL
eukprot:Em0578g2a